MKDPQREVEELRAGVNCAMVPHCLAGNVPEC